MKQIIPLKKDIIFKSTIGELSNLDLEHDYKINDDIISGTVAISGTYKMTEASIVEDDFYYTVPFSIAISSRINKDTIKIEIDDFKYEIEKDVLKVNIDLLLTCEENGEEVESDLNLDNYIDDYFNSEEKYYTYKVYIVRNGDTIEDICSKYNITYGELKNYNDLSEINVGDKIIIPSFNE